VPFAESPVDPGAWRGASGASILDSTVYTATVEPVDPDEPTVSTIITRSIEPSDADAFLAASTYVTESTEPADPDMIWLDSTIYTKSLEPADEDSIHPIFGFPGH
jgi:hypothetical protein